MNKDKHACKHAQSIPVIAIQWMKRLTYGEKIDIRRGDGGGRQAGRQAGGRGVRDRPS
jgi:hypothetical protein